MKLRKPLGCCLEKKQPLIRLKGKVGSVGHGKESGFYLRCNEKPGGSQQRSDMIKIYIQKPNLLYRY